MTSITKTIPNKSRRFPRPILWAALAVVLVAGGGTAYYLWNHRTVSAKAQSSPLQTATVTRGNIKLFASGTGTLVPSAQATFGFHSSGQVLQVLVKVGDVVEAGQLLARLDDSTAQLQLQQAKRSLSELTSPAAIASATSEVANDKVTVENKLATLAYLISPDVVYWQERMDQAQQALQTAKDEAAAHPSADADKKVKDAETALRIAKNYLAQATLDYWNDYVPATFLTVVQQGRTSFKKVIPPTDSQVAAAWSDYKLAKQVLAEAQDYLTALTTGIVPAGATGSNITTLILAQQAVQSAQKAVEDTQLYAPIHGTVLSLGFSVGDSVGSSSTMTIANLDQPYSVEIFLDQSDWSNIQVGFPVEVTFDLLPDSVYTGKVVSIDPDLQSTNGSLYVHAHVLLDGNVKTVLPFGTSASVDVIGGEEQNVLLVPMEALHEITPGQYAVFVMVNGKPQLRTVAVGLKDAVHAEIKSGLNEGDVVTTGITQTK